MIRINVVVLTGRLVADPTERATQGGVASASFKIAVKRRFKNTQTGQYESDFLMCQAWRQTAEYVAKYLRKGMMVCVEGGIQTRDYTNKDGQKVYVTEIVADNVENLTPREQAQQVDAQTGFPVASAEDNSDLPF